MQAEQRDDARAHSGTAMRRLATWAASPAARHLPEDVRRRAAVILMDDLGAMIAGATEPLVARAAEGLARTSGRAEATVFAPGARRLDRYTAATANGLAATWCELDEGYRRAPCHAGAYMLPALLAEAEAEGHSVAEVLEAVVIAYEITTRMARAFPFGTPMTVHPHAAFATIGAASAVSALRRHDEHKLLDSVSGAATMSFAGPYGHAIEGALVRNAWTAVGAVSGFRAADWAELGIGGLAETAYDVFAGSFRTGANPAVLAEELGANWAVLDGYHKVFACCQYAHSALESVLALHRRLDTPERLRAIDEIVVETHPLGRTLTTVEPATVLAAKFSMPHAVAAATLLGTGGAEAFTDHSLADPQIAALRRRVRLEPYTPVGAPPNDRPARVTWRFQDGTAWAESCESARGGADQPFDFQTLTEKFIRNTAGVFPTMWTIMDEIVAGKPAMLARSWTETVRMMIGRGSL
jgi:2-methylcitrate dehydratase PrpD